MNAPIVINKEKTSKKVGGVSSNSLIAVSEIFGPTIQGEGELIGTQTIFVRTGGCDYRCSWCDTGYAVLDKYKNEWQMMDAQSILQQIEILSNNTPMWITLSGGNPALQDFEELIKLGQAKSYRFSMETQGSIAKPWFALLDQLTLSPKPPSSGMKFKQRGLERCLEAAKSNNKDTPALSLKFVINDHEDLLWAKNIADQYPELPCFVQPCNTKADINKTPDGDETYESQQAILDLIDAVQRLYWTSVRVLPQLHNWIWGNKTGV